MELTATPVAVTPRYFSCHDTRAPRSPWGKVDSLREIARGVRWVGTPSHCGLGVAVGVARKVLSPAAIACGEKWGGYVWFEEDCACSIAFYEHPEWHAAIGFVNAYDRAETEASIRRWVPRYFDIREGRVAPPAVIEVGMALRAARDFNFSNGVTVTRISVVEVVKVPTGKTFHARFGGQVFAFQKWCFAAGELTVLG